MPSSAYLTPEQEWEAQMALYETLQNDASLGKNNTSLKNFQTSQSTKNIGKLVDVDGLAKNGNSKAAKIKLLSINNPSAIEKLNQDYRDLVLELSMHDSLAYDSSFKSQILGIANACETNGLIVKQARVLAQYLYNNSALIFANNCGTGSRINSNTIVESATESYNMNNIVSKYFILPNPNNGNFRILVNELGEGVVKFDYRIFDINGKLLFDGKIETKNNYLDINAKQLDKGIYFIQINSKEMLKFVKD